jgi:hypothetical protein
VQISGVGVAGYNGTFTITGVPTSTTFTYTDTATSLAGSGGGTAFASGALLNASGVATITLPSSSPLLQPLTVGTHHINAAYLGDGNYQSSISPGSLTQIVNKANTTILIASSTPVTAVYGAATITATVSPQFLGVPGGTVTFFVNNQAIETDPLVNGVATLKPLPPGTYNPITATYSGDGNFLPNLVSNSLAQTVTQASVSVLVISSANPSVFGQPVIFSAHINPVPPGANQTGSLLPAGTANLIIGGQPSLSQTNVPVTAGVVTFSAVSSLPISTTPYVIQVTYNGDTNYAANSAGSTLNPGQTVTQAPTTTTVTSSSNPSVFGQSVTFTATVSPAPSIATPDGTVSWTVDGVAVASNQNDPLTNGIDTYTTSALAVNTGTGHTIMATYTPGPSGNFAGSSGQLSGNQIVNKDPTTTTLSSSLSPSTYGQTPTVTFTATLTANTPGAGTPTTTVNFYLDSATGTLLGTGTLSGGAPDVASYITTITQLPGGAHTIFAVYQGDGNFKTSTGSFVQTINRAATTVTEPTSSNPGAFYGQGITFRATVSATTSGIGVPTGSISFFDGATQIGTSGVNASGVATITFPSTSPVLPALVAGSHTITAQYTGDNNFAVSPPSAQLIQNVAKAVTTTAIATNNANALYGAETITATVTNVSSGPTFVPPGNVTFTIMVGSTTLAPQTVALNASGVATLTAPSNVLTELTAGNSSVTYTISAKYLGDAAGNFATSSSTSPASITQTVSKDNSTTVLTATTTPPGSNQSVWGQTVTLTAQVTAGSSTALPSTGSVVLFFDGANQIGSGTLSPVAGVEQTSIQVSNLSVTGSPHTLTAKYQGDANFLTSSSTINFTVAQDNTTTTIKTSPSTSTYGTPVTLTATVSANAPGAGTPTTTVSFYANSVAPANLLGSGTLNNGTPDVASFTTSPTQLQGNTVSIIAVYQGDTNFITSQGSASQTVQKVNTTTTLASSTAIPVVNQTFTVTATVTSNVSGLSITGGTVTFTVDSVAQPAVAVSSMGQAVLTWSFSTPGNHTIGASYSGDVNFVGSIAAAPAVVNALDHNGGFVAQVYRDLLNREVDAAGLAFWTGLLDSNQISRTQFVLDLESSTEYRSDVVDGLYVKYLHRHADPGGLAFFVGQMGHGMTDEGVAAVLIGSPEFYALSGSTSTNVTPFLTLLYQDALYRQPDQAGLQSFTQALSFNVSRQQVASIVLASFEYKQDLVGGGPFGTPTVAPGYYNKFLHRNADPAGRDYWAGLMIRGMTDEQVIASIVGSDEYFSLV